MTRSPRHSIFYIALRSTRYPFFRPMHELARRFYVGRVIPWLNHRVPGAEILARHSATRPSKHFNVFGSDLDLAIIIPEALEPGAIRDIVTEIERLRSWMPFLGELEIQTESEWTERLLIESRQGPALDLLRTLRKLRWQEEAWAQAPSRYHGFKARESIARLLEKLQGLDGEGDPKPQKTGNLWAASAQIQKRILETLPGPNTRETPLQLSEIGTEIAPWKSFYFDCELALSGQPVESSRDLSLSLNLEALVRLIACSPPGHRPCPAIDPLAAQRRQDHAATAKLFEDACRHELLICRSVARFREALGQPQDPDLSHWMDVLGDQAPVNGE